jgi:hypothetical protein
MIGTAYIGILRYAGLRPQWQLLSTGVGTLLLLMFLPGGLAQLFYGARDAMLRAVAKRRDLVVPSLVADKRVDKATDNEKVKLEARSDRSLGSINLARYAAPDTKTITCPTCSEILTLPAASAHDHLATVPA